MDRGTMETMKMKDKTIKRIVNGVGAIIILYAIKFFVHIKLSYLSYQIYISYF